MSTNQNGSMIISYLTLRKLIGILGIALPVIVVLGGILQPVFFIQSSISSYYYTNMRDFFIGLLSVVALFLISYKGYEKIDNIVGNMSGAFALGIIFFPTAMLCDNDVNVGIFLIGDKISDFIHLTFAALFFLSLSFNSLFLFTKYNPDTLTEEKKKRNIIYRVCGIIMLLAIVCIAVYVFLLKHTCVSKLHPVLFFEGIALLAFGISWLIKGETFFKDKKS
jgi:hypothetical protein